MIMETYYGHVRSPADAIKLFEACRVGLLPRVQRRLSEKERQAIRSGSVFVWDEREAGMRRWTDGKSWSASRVAGSFLTYREMEGKRGGGFGNTGGRRTAGRTPDSGRGSDEDHDDGEPDGYRYKADGLMKQSFSITTSAGNHLHLISYYSRGQHDLPVPTSDPNLRNVQVPKGMYPESNSSEPSGPATMRGPIPQPMYAPPQQGQPHHPSPHQAPPHPAYSAPYAHPSAPWPPSPVATPPYTNGHYQHPAQAPAPAPYPPTTLPPPSQHHYSQGPPSHQYAYSAQPQYDRLPPPPAAAPPQPKAGLPLPQPYPTHAPPHHQQQHVPPSHSSQLHQQQHMSPPHQSRAPQQQQQKRVSPLDSPRSQQLQAAAREAVLIDPQLAANMARSQYQGPLPVPGQQQQQQQQNSASTLSPQTQALALSPSSAEVKRENSSSSAVPATAGNNKVSLNALLNKPANTESPSPTNSSTATGSPRPSQGGAAPVNGSANGASAMHGGRSMEVQALAALNKGFCTT